MGLNLGSYLPKLSNYESRNNPLAVSPTGAKGLFQFTRGTGRGYGLVGPGYDLRSDPTASTQAVTALTNDNASYLQNKGVPVTEQSLYMAHNIGASNAVSLYNNPDSLASSVVSSPNVIYVNNGRGLTSQQFIDMHSGKAGFTTAPLDGSSPMSTTNPTDLSGSSGLSAPGTFNGVSNPAPTGNYYYNPQTGAITPTTDNVYPGTDPAMNIDAEKGILYSAGTGPGASGAASMGGGGAGLGGFDSTGGFTGANVGMGGMGNGSTPSVTGLGAPGNGNPNGYSLDGATLNPNVTASNVADPVVGYNAAGPVMGAPTVTAAINQSGQKVSGSVDKGAKQIGDDTKKAGDTIGKSIDGTSKTMQSISDSWQALGKDYFLRVAFVVVGLIALAAGLMLFKPVQNAAVSVAKAAKKVPIPV